MMIYKNTKVKVRFPDGDTDYFNILQVCCKETHYVFKRSIDIRKDNGFKLAKERSRKYTAQAIMDKDYTDDRALLANTPAQAKIQLYSLEQAAAGIGLHVNADKTEYTCFNQRRDVSTLNGSSLKLVDKFTYLGSGISSTEMDLKTVLAKAWTAIHRQSVI